MIIAKDIDLKYPDGTLGIRGVNLNIPDGSITYISGPSGSGKTSFLKLLIGIELPTSGSLTVSGYDMNNLSDKELRALRRNIGPIFQDFKLLDGRTVMDNVLIGMRFLNFSNKNMKEAALSSIERVGLGHKVKSLVDNLSYGERQRVAIARAVARKPSLIIADEPTGNLDRDNSLNILELLKSFSDNETTVIITTHATHLIEDEVNCTKIHVLNGEFRVEEAAYENNR